MRSGQATRPSLAGLLRVALGLASLVAAFVHGCRAVAADAREAIIVIAGPAAGPYGELTRAVAAGVARAKARAESSPGAGQTKVRLVSIDDGCSAARGAEAAREAVARGAAAVIGHPCASAALAAAPIYKAAGVVLIAPATTHARLTAARPALLLRVAGRDDRQGRTAGRFLRDVFKGRPVALLSDKTVAGRALVDGAHAALAAAGATDVVVGHVTAGETDYLRLVHRLAEAKVAAVYFTGASTEAATIARQMRGTGFAARLIVAEAAAGADLWRSAGEAASGILALLPPDPLAVKEASPIVQELVASGIARPLAALRAHAAFEIWWQAARAAPDQRPGFAAIQGGTFATVIGPVTFSANGDARIPSYAVFELRDGRPVEVWSGDDGSE